MMFERAELLLQRFRNASGEEQSRIIQSMTPLDLAALDAWFECWAHRNQLPPNGDGWRANLRSSYEAHGSPGYAARRPYRSISPKTISSVPMIAATSASMWPRHR